ncbi:MAG: endonuclease/exonuclease/phosphatase family protein [Candidatus Omnitrophica bacterium]|nr:endonuclease/exonuclease/phosphatase family protein [Candidatus Omnitrophota bacterium]
MLKIVTFNTWGAYGPAERQPVLLEAIQELDADILCLQEVTDTSLFENLRYPACLHAPVSWLAILSRLPVLRYRHELYKTVSPLEGTPRGILLAEIQAGPSSFWIATTHLAWKAEDEPSRTAQTKELLDLVAPFRDRVLLSGDFNAPAGERPVREILQAGFSDLYSQFHPLDPGITWDNRNPFIQSHSVRFPDRRIDYLFLHKNAAGLLPPTRCEVVCRAPAANGLHPSDHYGVMAYFDKTFR